MERGEKYTFIVEGGDKSSNPARYHPFYITDSPEGGLGQASDDEQQRTHNYAGTAKDNLGYTYPTAGTHTNILFESFLYLDHPHIICQICFSF